MTRSYYASEGTRPQQPPPGYGPPQGYQPQGYQRPGPGSPAPGSSWGQQSSQQSGYGQQGFGNQSGYRQETGFGQPPAPGGPGAPGGLLPPPPQWDAPRKRPGRKGLLAIGSGALAVIVIAVVSVFVLKSQENHSGFQATAGSPSGDAKQVTAAFLSAWGSGNLGAAANLTDNPAAAQAALDAYGKGLNLKQLTGSPGSAVAVSPPAVPAGQQKPTSGPAASSTLESVKFQVNAKVAESQDSAALSGTWTYHSTLTAYQVPGGSGWFIQWKPDVVAPNLTASQHLAAVVVPPQVISVTDSAGNQLSSYGDPGLSRIGTLLQQKAPTGQGKPGLDVQIEDAKNKPVANMQAVVVSPQNIGQLATTIDPRAEAAAVAAVKKHKQSAMVAIQPSTGDILAIANNYGQNDIALTAAVAPGSTMKIITSTALFNNSVLTESTPVACPKSVSVEGITYHNDNNETMPAGTPFVSDFAQSCNNAFTQWYKQLNGKLASTAKDYYGLNQDWNIGISGKTAEYFHVPANSEGAELAQEAFGQGPLTACPLAVASVAATVANGSFKQPVMVKGTPTVSAKALPAKTDSQLKDLMKAVVKSGTAAGVGFSGDVFAKTGTADVGTAAQNEKPNSWMTAFQPSKDVAVSDLVVNAGMGADFAGPQIKAFLGQY